MRKILVPTDFSENAFNALKYACQVFKHEESEVYIVHAYADEVYKQGASNERSDLGKLKEGVFQNSEKQLRFLEGELRTFSPNPKHKYIFVSDFASLVDAVNDRVDQEHIDMVIMGTRGETNDRKSAFGSNTLQVMRYVKCPVLSIPEAYAFQPPKEVLFATNYMLPYKKGELQLVCDITEPFQSRIHMLYIDPIKNLSLRQEDHQEFLKLCLQKLEISFETSTEIDKASAITNYIVQYTIEMLVMVNSRHSYLENMLNLSTIDQLGLHIKVPFLVLQNIAR